MRSAILFALVGLAVICAASAKGVKNEKLDKVRYLKYKNAPFPDDRDSRILQRGNHFGRQNGLTLAQNGKNRGLKKSNIAEKVKALGIKTRTKGTRKNSRKQIVKDHQSPFLPSSKAAARTHQVGHERGMSLRHVAAERGMSLRHIAAERAAQLDRENPQWREEARQNKQENKKKKQAKKIAEGRKKQRIANKK